MRVVVYAVVYGNYIPMEVAGIYASSTLAQEEADKLDDDWHVEEVEVIGANTEYFIQPPGDETPSLVRFLMNPHGK